MRLIDADALVIDMVIEEAETPLMPWYPSHMPMRKTDGVSIEQINNSPTIDAVPVVRCKDCRWWDKTDNGFGYCHAEKHCHISAHWEISIFRTYRGDHFCADGEREDDE